MTPLFIILTIVAIANGLQRSRINSRIINGAQVTSKDVPYQASVLYNLSPVCGGSILNAHTILTAAHCTNGLEKELFLVCVGYDNMNDISKAQNMSIRKIVQHENYSDTTFDYDMSLLILENSLTFSLTVAPIALDSNVPKKGAYAQISGFGTINAEGAASSHLMAAGVPIFDQDMCVSLHNGKVTDQMICAGFISGTSDYCQDDSGGPLALDGKLVGVISYPPQCGTFWKPGVYASVSKMYEWLQNNIDSRQ